ncbi:MAG TPA: 30S ribosomal protein S6 [Terriglobia bacterium]|nr:30S ribosomal protein S6 [Terriglobia bacterium]
MRNYEIMFIVNPNAAEEEIDKINAQLESIITSGGGTVEKIEKMGKRRLAYEVDKHREGYYVLFVTTANGDIVKECERRLRVIDAVIKYLTVRTDEEGRRLEKIKSYRQKRAARRSRGATAPPAQSIEEAMQ